jgi:hypothetical protein
MQQGYSAASTLISFSGVLDISVVSAVGHVPSTLASTLKLK